MPRWLEARRKDADAAVSDPDVLAYVGDFDSGRSAVSAPIVGQAGLLQISPSNTAVGLTKTE